MMYEVRSKKKIGLAIQRIPASSPCPDLQETADATHAHDCLEDDVVVDSDRSKMSHRDLQDAADITQIR
jgi:hypothetical protein